MHGRQSSLGGIITVGKGDSPPESSFRRAQSRLDIEVFIPILFIWGIVDLVIGAIAVYAEVSILRGGMFGYIAGFTFAGLGIVRWLIHIPVSPVLAVVVIALNALVLYGLVEHEDYYS